MTLLKRLHNLAYRHLAIQMTAGSAWGIVGAAGVLLVGVWFDLLWEMPPPARIAVTLAAPLALVLCLAIKTALALKTAHPRQLARRLDASSNSEGQILTGVELALGARPGDPLTAGLVDLAVARASALAERTSKSRAIPWRPAWAALSGVGFVALVAICLAALAPRLFWAQWLRFTDPFGEHIPFARLQIHVEPGDVDVVYGTSLDIRAAVQGGDVEQLDLVLVANNSASEERLPMFPEPDGRWRATISHMTSPARYYIRAHAARSAKYQIGVVTVPQIKSVHFRVTPPAYTNRPPWEGPLPQGGLAVLRRTKVQIMARSNRPLSAGELRFEADDTTFTLLLAPTGPQAEEVAGEFEVAAGGKIKVQVTDVAGQVSNDRFAAPITLLRDERPVIRLVEPPALSFATANVKLPVLLAAEDDYGLTRLHIHRGLNESRALPLEVKLPKPAPLRWSATVQLPLATYGLQAGDEIRIFGRVEDTDPDGPNGAESPVAVIKIITQEELERMVVARQGIEAMINKYRQAQRRADKVADEVERLQKKAKSLSTEDAARALNELARGIREEMEAIDKLAQRDLPYDLDRELKHYLKDAASRLRKLEDRTRALSKAVPSPSELADALAGMARELKQQHDELDREAIEPMERLAAALPLLEDAARFVQIVEQQKALAQRLHSLKDQERPQDIVVVRRLSDGKTRQVAVRQRLVRLLDDIEDHLAQLPAEPDFDLLHEDASEFLKLARGTGAIDAMSEAEKGLADLSGSRGYVEAKRAAELLEALLKKSDHFAGGLPGVNAGRWIARFAPSLQKRLGDTITQMLTGKGVLPNEGQTGQGQPQAMEPVGLYGALNDFGPPLAARGERSGNGKTPGSGASHKAPNSRDSPHLALPAPGAAAEASVPSGYRRRVAEYFQRIAEETAK